MKYGRDHSRILDVVRGEVLCTDGEKIVSAMDLLRQLHAKNEIKIVKLKNRIKEPMITGYRDIIISFTVRSM